MNEWCVYCKWYIEDEYMCINSESRHYLAFMGEHCGCEKFKNADMRKEIGSKQDRSELSAYAETT